ncbi:hypothetical protein ACQQ2Q_04795 [Agrobacterium sp. ES01]|uniref:hypothetical protein n=1 Tax=Agrobacterium sp. ES01 TaxID=3420714 RepID=UPI003D129C19
MEELDEMVLSLWAIEAYKGYSPAQHERMIRYVRSLAAYDVTRPTWKRPLDVCHFDSHPIHQRIEPTIRAERQSALAHGLRVHESYKSCANAFGDLELADID